MRQAQKIVKHIQIIRRLLPMNCLSVFHYFVGLALKGLNVIFCLHLKTLNARTAFFISG